MFRLVRCLFAISTATVNCLGKFISEMACYVSSGMLNFTYPKPEVDLS